jgi:hypothetical protein
MQQRLIVPWHGSMLNSLCIQRNNKVKFDQHVPKQRFSRTLFRCYMQGNAVDIVALNTEWNSQTSNELLTKVVNSSVKCNLCIYEITHMHKGRLGSSQLHFLVCRRCFKKKSPVIQIFQFTVTLNFMSKFTRIKRKKNKRINFILTVWLSAR